MTDSSETVTDEYSYTAYGEQTLSTGSTENPYRWKGEIGYVFEEQSGLFSLRHRHYDVNQGRFISEDPIGLDSGDTNFYMYVGNNPVNSVDPSGLTEVYNPSTGGIVDVPPPAVQTYLDNNPGSFIVPRGPHGPNYKQCEVPPVEEEMDTCGPEIYRHLVSTLKAAENYAVAKLQENTGSYR